MLYKCHTVKSTLHTISFRRMISLYLFIFFLNHYFTRSDVVVSHLRSLVITVRSVMRNLTSSPWAEDRHAFSLLSTLVTPVWHGWYHSDIFPTKLSKRKFWGLLAYVNAWLRRSFYHGELTWWLVFWGSLGGSCFSFLQITGSVPELPEVASLKTKLPKFPDESVCEWLFTAASLISLSNFPHRSMGLNIPSYLSKVAAHMFLRVVVHMTLDKSTTERQMQKLSCKLHKQ